MNATKILWGQVLLVSAVVLAFVWAATEWTAWKLGFQPQLGHPWFDVFGWPVYQPPAFFWWWFAYDGFNFSRIRNSVCLRISMPAHAECSGTWARGSSPVPGLCAIWPATKTKSLQTTAGTKPEVGAEATPGGWTLRISYPASGITAIIE